jgi:hypothetical protein
VLVAFGDTTANLAAANLQAAAAPTLAPAMVATLPANNQGLPVGERAPVAAVLMTPP